MFTIETRSLGATERLCGILTEKEAADLVRARWGDDVHMTVGKRPQWKDGLPEGEYMNAGDVWEVRPCVEIWAEQPPDPLDGAPGRVFGPAGWTPDAALWGVKPEESIFPAESPAVRAAIEAFACGPMEPLPAYDPMPVHRALDGTAELQGLVDTFKLAVDIG